MPVPDQGTKSTKGKFRIDFHPSISYLSGENLSESNQIDSTLKLKTDNGWHENGAWMFRVSIVTRCAIEKATIEESTSLIYFSSACFLKCLRLFALLNLNLLNVLNGTLLAAVSIHQDTLH